MYIYLKIERMLYFSCQQISPICESCVSSISYKCQTRSKLNKNYKNFIL